MRESGWVKEYGALQAVRGNLVAVLHVSAVRSLDELHDNESLVEVLR